jgi:hypothetical protein
MSYVDAIHDKERDVIHVVERVNGVRRYESYPTNYVFYYSDQRGKYRSVYDEPVSRFSCRKRGEFQKELKMHGGKKTDLAALKKGGMAVKKMARGGGCEVKGKTKGTMIKMKKGGSC